MTQTRSYGRWIVLIVFVTATILMFAGLAHFGLWDPWELDATEHATRFRSQYPPLNGSAIRLGLALFGQHAWAGRFFGAVSAIAVVLTSMALSKHITDYRGMGYAGVITLTSPLLILQGQLMVGDALSMAAQSLLGLALIGMFLPFSEANQNRERTVCLIIGLASGLLTTATRGVLLGALPPCLACTCVLILQPPQTRDVRIFAAIVSMITICLCVGTTYAVFADRSNYSTWLGGIPRGGHPPSFDIGIKNVFHAFAPWSALAPIAIGYAATKEKNKEAFAYQASILWIVFAYGAYTVFSSRYGTPSYLAIAPLAALVSSWMRSIEETKTPDRLSAVIIVLLLGLLIRDYALYPASPLSGLPIDGFQMPEGFNPRNGWIILFVLFSITIVGALFFVNIWKRFQRFRLSPVIIAGLIMGIWISFGFIQKISLHFSQKQLYSTYIQLRQQNDLLLDFHTSGRATKYYAPEPIQLIDDKNILIARLSENQRRWAIFPREDLSSIDREFRKLSGKHLFGVDDSNARFLLMTNQPIANRQNTNVLANAIRSSISEVQHPVNAQFDELIELIGYDLELPHENYVRAGDTFYVTWYWRALTNVGRDYEVFLHIDGLGLRHNGDHIPVEGLAPVSTWEPGDIIVDRQELKFPRNFRNGNYSFYIGFFAGEDRLTVTRGPKDDENRVIAGQITIR